MRDRLLRARTPLAIAAVVLVAAVLAALSLPGDQGEALDPRNAAPRGSRALAQVLGEQGVTVRRETRSPQVAAAVRAAGRATVLVTDPTLLGPDQLARLGGTAADLVLLAPDAVALRALAPGVRTAGVVPAQDADPSCRGARAEVPNRAGDTRAGGHLFSSVEPGATVCYPADSEDRRTGSDATGSDATGSDATGSYVTVSSPTGVAVTVLGQADVLSNQYLAEQGNAALATSLLGARDTLIWYMPDPLELGPTDDAPTLRELLPSWPAWVLAQLGVALVLALAWRSRRLGRLVTEPLPVIVRSSETFQGRARLYRRAGARGLAATTLRTASLRRLAGRLDSGAGTAPVDVAARIAELTGRPEPEVRDLLLGPAPADDAALVALADELDRLEAALAPTRTSPLTHDLHSGSLRT